MPLIVYIFSFVSDSVSSSFELMYALLNIRPNYIGINILNWRTNEAKIQRNIVLFGAVYSAININPRKNFT